ncbi:alkaline phosphatase family protein [Paenibacillus sp. LHD-117]|uniref:alkaline phosphatase family protein n=1 Tax=Paenibacillus sp. LHD-117 TaxID=3071412 RepID=UPI0027E0982B|nr:alkaline phosphatase family protein [Paenibacillus sp. LHD-117]MDQ6423518.1 alkaline phosphatase family protein [Paenibacillus sp. LHD-117]
MNEKVLLILVDGMRPDALERCGHPFIERLKSAGGHTLEATTVMPSVTLPCHMSLFHSVPPQRHGILDNVHTPQVRPITGLFDHLHLHGKTSGMFYNWEQLRDLGRPGSLAHSCFISGTAYTYEETNYMLTEQAVSYIRAQSPDFTFLYLGLVDEVGHRHGWMSEAYIDSVHASWSCIERAVSALPPEYAVIVTADHGGHDRTHGTDMPEDMTIPLFIKSRSIPTASGLPNANIIDLAPTIAKLIGVPSNPDWEGRSLLQDATD